MANMLQNSQSTPSSLTKQLEQQEYSIKVGKNFVDEFKIGGSPDDRVTQKMINDKTNDGLEILTKDLINIIQENEIGPTIAGTSPQVIERTEIGEKKATIG